ncbi:MAG: hypothetical protein ACI837_003112 [Crocinitomicaceae bacterium]|jgi:hypothetical protein
MRIYLIPILFLMCACTQTSPSPESDSQESKTDILDKPTETEDDEETVIGDTITTNVDSEEYASKEYEDVNWDEYEQSMTKDFSFVIVISTKSYQAALDKAKDASKRLGYPLDLRGLHPNDEMGLSLPEDVCEAICGGDVVDYPQYLPRNDWGETKYVSIEYSNGFAGFTKGYYIVVVASGEKGDPVVNQALKESRKIYKDAYAKTCGVWMGCGC